MMTNREMLSISQYVDSLFPNAKCELFYSKDYELAIAVMLSAQTTDKAVNKVTKKLFKDFPTLKSFVDADVIDIEEHIKCLGLYKNKAANIKALAKKLYFEYDGVLPSDKKLLTTLPGIGNKSAGVIRIEIFKIPDLPVDTHVKRVSTRLGIAKESDTPDDVEQKLKKLIPESSWIKTHHQLIHFGRYFCTAKSPKCDECKLRNKCKY